MKTVVYQSYRTTNVPPWVARCLQTVKDWAAGHGFDYRFIDDRMFSYAPPWYREKVADNVLLVSDLARLELAREFLSQGYERTVWVDADVVVFDPQRLTIDVTEEYAFCREVWVTPHPDGRLACLDAVNNAVTVFVRSNHFLDFYIHACQSVVRHKAKPDKLDVGTRFLTALHQLVRFPLLGGVGLLSPVMMTAVAGNNEPLLRAYAEFVGSPFYAANLCGSFRGTDWDGVSMGDEVYGAVVDALLQTRGEILNKHHGRPVAGQAGQEDRSAQSAEAGSAAPDPANAGTAGLTR